MHTERDTVMASLSVRPSVTLWHFVETNANIVKIFPQSGRDMICFLEAYTTVTKFEGELPRRGRYIRGVGKFAMFDRNRRLSRKRRYKIGPWLLWITNRKS